MSPSQPRYSLLVDDRECRSALLPLLLQASDFAVRATCLPVGHVVSRLLRHPLTGERGKAPPAPSATGFRPFASRGVPVTNDDIDRLRDSEGL